MTDLSGVRRVRYVDALGRTHRSFNAENIVITLDDGTLTIRSDGDTAYGKENKHAS